MESEQSPSIGKDSCPIIETTRHRSMENGKRNPDLHAQVYTVAELSSTLCSYRHGATR